MKEQETLLMPIKDACAYIGVGETKFREILRRPDVNFSIRIGNKIFINREKLKIWLDKCTENRVHL